MKICIYARVSTDDQNVNQQVDYLIKYCQRNEYPVIKTVKDEESGRLPLLQRKKFHAMINDSLTTLSYEAILIYNLDRLTRNWDDVTFIEKHFRENWNRIKLISTADSIDLSNASGRLQFRLKMAINCYMPEDMREKQIIGIERAKAEGKYKGGAKGRSWTN